MDPISITLAQRLQAVLFRKQIRDNFSKLFQNNQKHTVVENFDSEEAACATIPDAKALDTPEGEVVVKEGSDGALDEHNEQDDAKETSAEPIPLDEQSQREAKYIWFDSDEADPGDYTRGPARFILGDDGIQQCAALLFTYDLSGMMQKTVLNQRRYLREARQAKQQTKRIEQFEREIKQEIQSHKTRAVILEKETAPEVEIDTKLVDSLKKEMEVLERMKSDMEREKGRIERNLRFREKSHREKQQAVNSILEEAMIDCALIGPDEGEDLPVVEFDLQEEYKKTFKAMYDPEPDILGGYTPEPSELDTSRDYLRRHVPEPTPEQQAADLEREEATEALEQAFEQLNTAEYQFEHKEFSRDQDLQQCIEQGQRGEEIPYESREDFDLNWVRNFGEITRNLIEAEKAVAEAKKAAKAVGVKYTSAWQDSEYVDEYRPGYPLSQEIDVAQVQQAVMPSVESWLETVEDVDVEVSAEGQDGLGNEPVPESSIDLEEWSCREVEIGDSLSCVDLDWHREKIDRWRRACQGDH